MSPRPPLHLCLALAAAVLLLSGCPQPNGPGGPRPGLPATVRMLEDFEGTTWFTLEGSTPSTAPVVSTGTAQQGSGSLLFRSLDIPDTGSLTARASTLNLPLAANLRFWYKTDLGGNQGGCDTWLRVYDNEVKIAEFAGLQQPWKLCDLALAAGTHHLRFSAEKGNSTYYLPPITNSAWVDQVSVCDDVTETVTLSPAGDQRSVVGQPLVQYRGTALRWDGSVRTGQPVQVSVVPGTGSGSLGGDGTFTGSTEGTCTVRASSGGIQSSTGTMTVLPVEYLSQPTWQGGAYYAGLTAQSGVTVNTASRTFTDNGATVTYRITSPQKKTLTADGFVTITGTATATNPAYQYLWVVVQKDSDPTLTTSYWLRGTFSKRLWLRFGSGAYTISVVATKQATNNLGYEGDIESFTSWSPDLETFSVTNTRDEDGRFFYPSDPLQADSLEILNRASSLTAGLTGDYAKLKALHDYTVRTLDYDYSSLDPGMRKKQDALTSLSLGIGVCEGYSSLFGALARAAGLRAKAVGGFGGTGTPSYNHAWNLVTYQGAERMIDCTWDDPGSGPSAAPNYGYFLCGPTGSGDHVWYEDRPGRGVDPVTPSPVLTAVEGGRFGSYPAGWY